MNRRDFSRTALFGAAASLAASAVSPFARSAEPLKIGVLAPLSGPLTRVGQTNRNCAALAVDEINAAGGLLGRPSCVTTSR
jgi:branched-chain amino acid transport system substrate-binding protein